MMGLHVLRGESAAWAQSPMSVSRISEFPPNPDSEFRIPNSGVEISEFFGSASARPDRLARVTGCLCNMCAGSGPSLTPFRISAEFPNFLKFRIRNSGNSEFFGSASARPDRLARVAVCLCNMCAGSGPSLAPFRISAEFRSATEFRIRGENSAGEKSLRNTSPIVFHTFSPLCQCVRTACGARGQLFRI